MATLELIDDAINFVKINTDDSYKIQSCHGINELEKLLSTVKAKRLFLLFCGDIIDGKSWCPDCVEAKPVIDQNLKYMHPNDDAFITVYVGERDAWKDKKNIFRTDDRFKVQGVPTLFEYGTQRRLVEAQCASNNLVRMIFEDEDD